MSTLEEIRQMMREGKSGQEIAATLQQRGVPMHEIENAFSQAQIKEAVIAPSMPMPSGEDLVSTSPIPEPPRFDEKLSEEPPAYNLEPSMMQMPQGEQQQEVSAPYPSAPEVVPEPGQPYAEQYDYSQYAQPQISADTISEIAEQIVSEKLSKMRTKIDKVIDLKTTVEAKVSHLNERLQRIENIIDNLQMSILQKVGEYTINVADLKKELVETQKSFGALEQGKIGYHERKQHKVHKRK